MLELPEPQLQALREHLASHFGPPQGEIRVPTEAGPLTLLHVPPTPEVPFHVLVTAGASAAEMAVPEEAEDVGRHAELMLLLPFDWPVERGLEGAHTAWPLRVLASIAAFPAAYEAWLAPGHSLPNGDPPGPFVPDLDFCGVVIAPPMSLPPQARRFARPDGVQVELLAVLPVFERELELKQEQGAAELLRRFDAAGVNELLDVSRQSVAGMFIELLDRKPD